MSTRIRLAIIDDHPLFREGVIRSLSELEDFEVVGEGGSVTDALRIAETTRPDIVLLDISMPGDGQTAIPLILAANREQKIVVLTVSEDSDDIGRSLKAGAKGYVLKGVGSRVLAEILRTVAAGEVYLSPTLSARMIAALNSDPAEKIDPLETLTVRERQILDLVARGLSNKHVALQLDLHEKTVKHHMTRVLAKLKVTNRTEAALAFRDASESRRHFA